MFRLLSNYAPNFESNELVLQKSKINKINIAERDSFFLFFGYVTIARTYEIGSVEPQKLHARKSNRFTCLRSLPIVSETIRAKRLRFAGHCARHNESAEDTASKVLL